MTVGKNRGKTQAALDAALELLRAFLTDRKPKCQDPDLVFSQVWGSEKAIDLDRESIKPFRELMDAFERCAELGRTLTSRSVERLVEHAIVKHFDGGDVAATLKVLRAELAKTASPFTIYVPVAGFSRDSVPGQVGGVSIISVDEGTQRLLADNSPPVQHALSIILGPWQRTPPQEPGALLEIVVHAAEPDAAKEIALDRARGIVDVVHFFSNGHGLHDARLSVANDHMQPHIRSLVVSLDPRDGSIGGQSILAGSASAFHLRRHSRDPAWEPASQMLAKATPNAVESLLLTSMAWSGRATVEPRRDLAFTQFAIALESLMIPKEKNEVTDRLATRVTRLLAAKLTNQSPIDMFREVKRYYAIRSKVVHNGFTEISNVDLFGLHHLTKWVTRRLVRVCHELGFVSLDELEAWLTLLAIGAATVPEPQPTPTEPS